jgi:hypothetical protein
MAHLCKICNREGRENTWVPTPVSNFESILSRKIPGVSPREITSIREGRIHTETIISPTNYEYGLRKNICYSLQHLEYILTANSQLQLTTVLTFQNYKTFVIVSASIVEGILFHELKSKSLHSKNILRSLGKTSSQKKIYDKLHTFVTEIFEHIDAYDEDMTFDQMLSKVESKKLLGENHQIYSDINALRKLRNKIHIHLAGSRQETDYNTFNYRKLDFAKSTLLSVLKIYFSLTPQEVDSTFLFLKPPNNGDNLTIDEAQELGFI